MKKASGNRGLFYFADIFSGVEGDEDHCGTSIMCQAGWSPAPPDSTLLETFWKSHLVQRCSDPQSISLFQQSFVVQLVSRDDVRESAHAYAYVIC